MKVFNQDQEKELKKIIEYIVSYDDQISKMGIELLRKSSIYRGLRSQSLFYYPDKTASSKKVRLSTFIEEHDIQVKAKAASKFLQEGNRVKVSLRLRGRERDYANHAIEVMNDFAESLAEICIVDKKPKFEGRGINMFLSPRSDKDK